MSAENPFLTLRPTSTEPQPPEAQPQTKAAVAVAAAVSQQKCGSENNSVGDTNEVEASALLEGRLENVLRVTVQQGKEKCVYLQGKMS